ncbi:MAG: SUMF1/EgtB/PvdO family nonheme iron enzyme, partial [Mariprofundaceae bacterium]|nr:SUMF1/EgtB/PvdO family nonheme iron enzyme [Mariprofundaceae bacterium]
KETQMDVDLEPVSGRINIKTVPAGASILINGEAAGISPLSIGKTGGAYRLEITLDDYQNINETAEITNSDNIIERDYHLMLKDAYVNVSVSPAGGKLLLNGKVVQPSETLTIKARTRNSLVYTKIGYFSQDKRISAVPGEKQHANFKLKAETGKISFISSPLANIRVDGKEVGQTPLVLSLSAVPHRVEFHKQGYRAYRKTVIPSSKSTQKIRAVLRTELDARLAEMPVRFKNSAGIELKQFRANDSVVMGAPRSEKGQRANEFLQTVRLSKPFYVSTHEVTRSQFSRFAKGHGSGNEPVSGISWLEAAQFCNWLSQREKLTPFYRINGNQLSGSNTGADGYRLPSEAEWEWLARKAGKVAQTRFTWGDETVIPEKSGNIADESAKGTSRHYVPNYSDGYAGVATVGSFPAERSGLYDMTGNLSEWVHDVYSLTPPAAGQVQTDPLGETRGDTHTVKGSNWRSGTITKLRAAYREGEKVARDDIGFRIAKYVYGGAHGQ